MIIELIEGIIDRMLYMLCFPELKAFQSLGCGCSHSTP
jgi:hypothetical protein